MNIIKKAVISILIFVPIYYILAVFFGAPVFRSTIKFY